MGERAVDAQQGDEAGVDQPRGDERRGGGRSREVGVDAHGIEREELDLAAVAAEDQQKGRLQVERLAVGCGRGHGVVGERLALGGGGQQQDAQVGHGDARRADEDVFPGRFERGGRAAVVDDARRAEGRGLEEDPRHGEVVGEVDARNGGRQQQEQRRVDAHLCGVLALEVALGVDEGEARDDGEQHVEERARGVEGEEPGRGRAVARGDDPHGEGGLHGVEEHAGGEELPVAARGEGRRRGKDAECEVTEHGVSLLRWSGRRRRRRGSCRRSS